MSRSPFVGSVALATVVALLVASGCGSEGRTATLPGASVRRSERPARQGFYARWEWPTGARHKTTIVLLGGSDGGIVHTDLVSALVAHGYPVLDLAYFREPGLPQTLERIRLEYFQRALRWLSAQPQVDPRRVVTFGISRGGELSLILASTFPTLVHGAIEYVGGWFVGTGLPDPSQPAWTYHGKPVDGWPVTGIIPVWMINGPVFATGGGDDTLAHSAQSVQTIVREMHQHGRSDVTGLIYPDAGHLLGLVLPVHYPNYGNNAYGVVNLWTGQQLNLGGSASADLAARKDAWSKLLAYLSRV